MTAFGSGGTAVDAPPIFGYIGCFRLSTGGTTDAFISGSMTIETCLSHCRSGGNNYAGVKAGTQCYCSTSFGLISGSTECQSPCPGNTSESCGGLEAIQMYQLGGTSVGQPPAPVGTPSWKYLNCYWDQDPNNRLLNGASYQSDAMTQDSCNSVCASAGYAFAGTEFGSAFLARHNRSAN